MAEAQITETIWARREGNLTEFKFRPEMRGLPPLSPKWVQQIRLTPAKRVDITNAPPPRNRLSHPLLIFTASRGDSAGEGVPGRKRLAAWVNASGGSVSGSRRSYSG